MSARLGSLHPAIDRPINLGAPTRFTRRAWIRRGLLCGTGLRPHFSPSAVGRSGFLTRGVIQGTLLQPQPVDQFPRRRVSISAPRRVHVRGDACPGCQRVFVGVSIRAPRSRAGRPAALPTGSVATPYYRICANITILAACEVIRLSKNSEKLQISLRFQRSAKTSRLSRHFGFAPRSA